MYNGGAVLNTLSQLASRVIPSKKFTINCTDSASSVVSRVNGLRISDKRFKIDCTDNATAKVNRVISKKYQINHLL